MKSRKEYQDKIVKNLDENNCEFCRLKDKYILWKGQHFCITVNLYPYGGSSRHLLVIPFKHKHSTSAITAEEFSEFTYIEKFMKDYYKDDDYFSFVRQTMGGRSVAHLHYHYLPGIMYPKYIEQMLTDQGV